MQRYRVTAMADGKKVTKELEALTADSAWDTVNKDYGGGLYNGDVEELPTRAELQARVAELEAKLAATKG